MSLWSYNIYKGLYTQIIHFLYIKMKNKNQETKRSFRITKKIAKHGSQNIIIVPRILESSLKPGTIVELNINVLEDLNDEEEKWNSIKN